MGVRHDTQGPVAQLVSAPPCHGGGRRFEPGRGRSNEGRRIIDAAPFVVPPVRARESGTTEAWVDQG